MNSREPLIEVSKLRQTQVINDKYDDKIINLNQQIFQLKLFKFKNQEN
jgi:hypothetical protein